MAISRMTDVAANSAVTLHGRPELGAGQCLNIVADADVPWCADHGIAEQRPVYGAQDWDSDDTCE